ncbi:hypothetical protein M0R72_07955 [Candidatus Pacearchaeota archaeon]|jgi:hypothetical protein|nr:hypothetical protein [Candidatus Pacearchaeota archaeon]
MGGSFQAFIRMSANIGQLMQIKLLLPTIHYHSIIYESGQAPAIIGILREMKNGDLREGA